MCTLFLPGEQNMCSFAALEDVAYTWGLDDALEGLRPRPAEYFWLNSPQWQEYEAGYLAGIEHVFCLPSRSVRVALPTERHADLLTDEEDRRRVQRR
jgi:hypothetical protein